VAGSVIEVIETCAGKDPVGARIESAAGVVSGLGDEVIKSSVNTNGAGNDGVRLLRLGARESGEGPCARDVLLADAVPGADGLIDTGEGRERPAMFSLTVT